jgi:uncharacterized protein
MKRKYKRIFLILLLPLAIFVWGNLIEPRWIDEVYEKARVPDLPKEWEGRRIAFISDIQIGIWLGNEGTVRRIVARIIEESPMAVLIGGDFIYHPTEDDTVGEALEEYEKEDAAETRELIAKITHMLRPLISAGLPVYAVFGNHDYAMETQEALQLAWIARDLEAALEKTGVVVLRNEAVKIKNTQAEEGSPLYIVGIGPYYPAEDRVSMAFAYLPAGVPRIVIMHNPQTFAKIPAGLAPLSIAGHTHGGQVRIPFLPSWSWISIVKEGEVNSDGWIENFGNDENRLYVNRGIGFSRVPIRINCRPEVTFFELVREYSPTPDES